MRPRFLFLFPDNWDRAALAGAAPLAREFDVVCEGFDLFRVPGNARILAFDARRFVDRLARRYGGGAVVGVAATHEQYGALIAAAVARALGLPGTDPRAIVRAQHKHLARTALAGALPAANPAFALLPRAAGADPLAPLPFPFFVKPVKAAYSILARRVDDPAALAQHLTFSSFEAHLLARLVRPFADLARTIEPAAPDPLGMLAEELMDGAQVNVDGWMDRGEIAFFGIVDSVMYPGTQAFARFEYPSRLPPAAQAEAFATAAAAVRAVGFDHGAFNVELFCDPVTGRARVIEINPRFAAQFGDLYEMVDGTHPYAVLADLAVGRTPRYTRRAGRHAAAASFVHRAFDDAPRAAPARAARAWLAARHPDAALHTFIKRGAGRAREMKWLGSYRHAIVNLGGDSPEDLEATHADIARRLDFARPRLPGDALGVARAALERLFVARA